MKIDFQFETQYGMFADALDFDDAAVPSESEIEVLKQERLANWLAIVTPVLPEETQPAEEV